MTAEATPSHPPELEYEVAIWASLVCDPNGRRGMSSPTSSSYDYPSAATHKHVMAAVALTDMADGISSDGNGTH